MSQHNESAHGNNKKKPKDRQESNTKKSKGTPTTQGQCFIQSEEQRSFHEAQNQCALCSTPLLIEAISYLEDYYIREEAECPQCAIKTRVKNHKMQ